MSYSFGWFLPVRPDLSILFANLFDRLVLGALGSGRTCHGTTVVQQVPEHTSLPEQVVRHLLELISRNRLVAGDPVPSELQICRDLDVSRGSVREAFRTLSALGILEIESGKRPRLRQLGGDALARVFGYALTTAQVSASHVIETRRAIEVQSAQQAARYATDAHRRDLRAHVEEMRASLEDGDHQRRLMADMAIHTLLAEASRNPLTALLLASLRAPLERLMRVDVGERRSQVELVRIVDAHELIVARVCAGDAVGAGAAMSLHFDLSFASGPVSDDEVFSASPHPEKSDAA